MKKKKNSLVPSSRTVLLRKHRMTFLFNDEEMKVFKHYISKYKVRNQSRFIRETIMVAVLKQLEIDHPTLFD